MTAPTNLPPRWFALPLLALGAAGFAAAWALVSLRFDHMLAGLALLAAADMVLLLAIGRWPAGTSRAAWAMLGTAATIALAHFAIIAGQVGRDMGLPPWESALRLGPCHAWELARLASPAFDRVIYAAALLLAAWAGLNARRQVPSAR
jgi:hypothetical protein